MPLIKQQKVSACADLKCQIPVDFHTEPAANCCWCWQSVWHVHRDCKAKIAVLAFIYDLLRKQSQQRRSFMWEFTGNNLLICRDHYKFLSCQENNPETLGVLLLKAQECSSFVVSFISNKVVVRVKQPFCPVVAFRFFQSFSGWRRWKDSFSCL